MSGLPAGNYRKHTASREQRTSPSGAAFLTTHEPYNRVLVEVEFAVVGGGAMGLSAAYRLARAGREVLLLERFRLGHDRGSSHGATRIFRFAYHDPVYVRMAQAALPLWRELERGGREILRITGGIDVGAPGYLDRCARALEACGAAAERLDPATRSARFPWLRAGEEPALFSPDTGVIAAATAVEAMAGEARAMGAQVWEECPVERLAVGDRVSLGTARGDVRARRCVLAAGAWTGPLLAGVGIELPLRVTREQVFYFRGGEHLVPFIHRGPVARYGTPAFGGAAGVKVAEHATGEETSANGRSFEPDPEGAARVADYVRATLPSLDPEPVALETCLYTMTPDEDFALGARGPLVIASACSGHGFKFAPLIGEVLARLAAGGEPPVDLGRFTLARFR